MLNVYFCIANASNLQWISTNEIMNNAYSIYENINVFLLKDKIHRCVFPYKLDMLKELGIS